MTQQTQALTLTSNQLESAISNPGGVGTIEAYISAVYRMPMLTREEEVELGERMRGHADLDAARQLIMAHLDRKSTRLNSSHVSKSYAVVCLKKIKQVTAPRYGERI